MIRFAAIGRSGVLVAAFLLGLGISIATQARAGQNTQRGKDGKMQTDEHPRFPPGEGRDVTLRVCSKCHSPDSAADQQLDAAGWQDLVNQMVATGAEMTPQEYDQIVSYLAKAFPPK